MSEVDKESTSEENKTCDGASGEETEHDPHYDPIISLPEVEVPTLEEDETVMLSLRAKLYRYDANETPPEWKERGTGTVKILCHKINNTVRVVMRRDKTLKLCANHFITPFMSLKPNASCKRAWVYSVKDYSDANIKSELLAIKFANIENAEKWKEVFEDAKKIVANYENSKADTNVEDKIIPGGTPKLNDTFDEDKKEVELKSPKKSSSEMTEKLSVMSLKEAGDS